MRNHLITIRLTQMQQNFLDKFFLGYVNISIIFLYQLRLQINSKHNLCTNLVTFSMKSFQLQQFCSNVAVEQSMATLFPLACRFLVRRLGRQESAMSKTVSSFWQTHPSQTRRYRQRFISKTSKQYVKKRSTLRVLFALFASFSTV